VSIINTNRDLLGSSPSFIAAVRQVDIVAPADCTVLLQGETGTGKELFARAVHEQSPRRSGPFVKVNCAAIPSGLLESELFGHDKGAYTGAVTQTSGRFQLAHGGTLFLDEIGDLPLELQPKLLRVLQESEFERLGSPRTIRVDVRVVAATHQDLSRMVEERRYRADLFYRLNVFPISIPPLRDRANDIPALVRHFVQHFAVRRRKVIDTISDEAMESLCSYHWPGNIRELQNIVERSVLLSQTGILHLPAEFSCPAPARRSSPFRTLVETERQSICEALRRTNWVIGGNAGAAVQLGIPRTTLIARMRKHGITRELQGNAQFHSPEAASAPRAMGAIA
jgi:formate hydrogenlyase transcriptional activator